MNIKLLVALSFMMLTISSCDRPRCENKNPVFDEFSIDSNIYKEELIKQINAIGKDNLSYWFYSYYKKNERDYIVVNIQNDSLCTKGEFLVRDWNKIEGIKKRKGKGYVGAELRNFSFDVEKDSLNLDLIYKDLTYIID